MFKNSIVPWLRAQFYIFKQTEMWTNQLEFVKWLTQNYNNRNGILFPKLFWPAVRKKWSSDWEKLLKFESEGREFAKKKLRSLEQFIQTVKGSTNFWNSLLFSTYFWRFLRSNILKSLIDEQIGINEQGWKKCHSAYLLHTACMSFWMTKRQAISTDTFQAC